MRKKLQHIQLSKASEKAGNENPEHLDFGAGFAPYLRGADATMYVRKPWDNKQYSSFNKTGVNSVEDMKALLSNITPRDVSMCIDVDDNNLPILAFYIVATEGSGLHEEQLSVSLQFDALKATDSSFTPALKNKITADILAYTGSNMPKFNNYIISGYGLHEAGATADIELAYTLAYGLEIIRCGLASGINIDELTQRLTFSFSVGMGHFAEIAKMRAARMLWAKALQQFNPKDEKSPALRIHSQTSSASLTATDPFNNVARICSEAAAAVFGGTQSLQTLSHDGATGQSSESGTQLAHNMQLFLQEETKVTKTVDPWGGSHYVESLTDEIIQKAWALIEETEALGGFFEAVEAGIYQQRIEEAATLKQSLTDSAEAIIVGINKYRFIKDTLPQIQEEDTSTLQDKHLGQTNAARNIDAIVKTLNETIQAVQSGNRNLLELFVKAARHGATAVEINSAIKVNHENRR